MEVPEEEAPARPRRRVGMSFAEISWYFVIASLLLLCLPSWTPLAIVAITMTGFCGMMAAVFGALALLSFALRRPPKAMGWKAPVGLVWGVLFIVNIFQIHKGDRYPAYVTTCLNNQKSLVTAMLMDMQDHDDRFPASLAKLDMPDKAMSCPYTARKDAAPIPYVYNRHLVGLTLGEVADEEHTLVTADGLPGNDGFFSRGAEIGLHHRDDKRPVACVSYLDGHTGTLTREELATRNLTGQNRLHLIPVRQQKGERGRP